MHLKKEQHPLISSVNYKHLLKVKRAHLRVIFSSTIWLSFAQSQASSMTQLRTSRHAQRESRSLSMLTAHSHSFSRTQIVIKKLLLAQKKLRISSRQNLTITAASFWRNNRHKSAKSCSRQVITCHTFIKLSAMCTYTWSNQIWLISI